MDSKSNSNLKRVVMVFLATFFSFNVFSNNVSISINSVTASPYEIFTVVDFTLTWENSYFLPNGGLNTEDRKDGVYVFFKAKVYDNNNWNACGPLTAQCSGCPYYTTVAPITGINTSRGYLFYRNTSGNGTITANIQVYIYTGYIVDFDVKGFAIEMVNKPSQNSIWYGDGNGPSESTNSFHSIIGNFKTNNYISTDVNTFDDDELDADYITVASGGILDAAINNPNFPVGLGNYWCMKYEISQGAYRDFLNTLTYDQQVTRTANLPTAAIGTGALTTSGTNRNWLEIKTPSDGLSPAKYGCDANGNNIFDEANDGEYVACNFLSWMDIAAYLDWSALAPMTETQYEHVNKNYQAVYYEDKAWGISLNAAALTLTNAGAANESISNASSTLGNANYIISNINGPLRNGIFSTATSDTKKKSGGSHFGAMEMSGNLYEACVTIGNVAGRSFNKTQTSILSNGDGVLALNGNAEVYYWPGNVATTTLETSGGAEVTTSAGTIRRGGSWNSPATELRVADRSQGEVPTTRTATQGGRGVLNL